MTDESGLVGFRQCCSGWLGVDLGPQLGPPNLVPWMSSTLTVPPREGVKFLAFHR